MREPKASLLEVILAGVYNDYSKHTKEFLVEGMLPLPSVFFLKLTSNLLQNGGMMGMMSWELRRQGDVYASLVWMRPLNS